MIPERVARVLLEHGLRALEFEPGTTATAELAAARLGVQVGQIAKSLLFIAKDGRLCMLLCPGDRKVASGKLKAAVGAKLRMTRPEETRAATGFEPGGVCPFGIDASISIFLDESLTQYPMIYPAAGTNASGVPMTLDQLVAITRGQVGDFTIAADFPDAG
jgi:Cys-tRNA(Pro) deacylase